LRRDVHGLGQIIQPHFALRENHVQIDDDGHVKAKDEGKMQNAETGFRPSVGWFLHSSFCLFPLFFKPSIPVPRGSYALHQTTSRGK
jgi:hypothetical protein